MTDLITWLAGLFGGGAKGSESPTIINVALPDPSLGSPIPKVTSDLPERLHQFPGDPGTNGTAVKIDVGGFPLPPEPGPTER